jgi:hypothetical protein
VRDTDVKPVARILVDLDLNLLGEAITASQSLLVSMLRFLLWALDKEDFWFWINS